MTFAPTELLREANLRVTGPRLAVLTEVEAHPHSTAEAIVEAVRDRLGTATIQSVYHILNALTDAHILRRIAQKGSPDRFERSPDVNQQQLACRTCVQ